ncbi:MAG: ATP-binding protein, partial [Verrucomicrobiota bacterium]
MAKRVNVLGDIRAEHDKQMLELAFYETPDYRTLIESSERPIVVGRRGTGKSALCNQLKKYWQKDANTIVLEIVPEEDQVIGLRPLLGFFGDKYNQIKAAARIVWKYGLLVEVATRLIDQRKLSRTDSSELVFAHVQNWRKLKGRITGKVRELLHDKIQKGDSPAATIAGLVQVLQLQELQESLTVMLTKSRSSFVFLIDQLDEGFEPDELGVGLVGGFVHAAVDTNSQIFGIRTYIFLRDNIFKALAQLDPDYSKNIEGRFLRLHWDEHQLFDLVCARLRVAFSLEPDGNRKIWNRCTADDLQEKAGFEKCLRLTLYRPRDVLSLLNEAFYNAQKQNRETLILKDVESTAREISNTRLDDLFKEYAAIIPVLKLLTSVFRGRNPEVAYKEAIEGIEVLFNNQKLEASYQREFAILETAHEGIRTLYSVGFLGIKDSASNAFVFCHDGRSPSKQFQPEDRLLIHPCYWMALDATKTVLGIEEATDIHDEYEVEVFSEAPQIRNHRIGQLIAKLDKIPTGVDGASEFEEWCLKAIRICFSGPLRNIELHANKNATQRRDVIASNQSE